MADAQTNLTHGHSSADTRVPMENPGPEADIAIDPVCGMKVDPAASKHRFDHDGKTFHFCSARCQEKFSADPAAYLKPAARLVTPVKAGTIFTCPMHPEIKQEGPGSCPICGMALEPLVATAEAQPNHELTDMTRRFWIGLVLSSPVFVLEMGGHVPWLGLHHLVPATVSTWIQFALSTPVVLWAGFPFFQRAWASVLNKSLNMFSLIALGTGAAYLYSLFAAFAPDLFPAGFRGMDNTVAVYFEAAAVITVLVLLGQVLELRAREQTGGAIRALLNLAPKTARRLTEGGKTRKSRFRKFRPATGCACVPATACRSMARCWRARARSMKPWSPASPCPRRNRPATR